MIYRPHIIEHHIRGKHRINLAALIAMYALYAPGKLPFQQQKVSHPERYQYL